MQKTRMEYLDRAKALLILLVVLGHILIVMNPRYDVLLLNAGESFLMTFHMPAFFVIHGILCKEDVWRQIPVTTFLKKRVKGLLIPYLFFETLGILVRRLVQDQSLLTGIYQTVTIRCNVGADWFLPAMFLGDCLYLLSIRLPGKVLPAVSVVVSLCLPMVLPAGQIFTVLGRALLAYGFIRLGSLLRDRLTGEKVEAFSVIFLAFLLTALCAVVNLKFGGNDFYYSKVSNPVTLILGGLAGSVMILGTSRRMIWSILAELGKVSLIIMGTHQLVIYMMNPWLQEFSNIWLRGVVLAAAILAFEIPAIWLLKTKLPWLVGMKK